MEPSGTLETLAEVSVTLSGFSGLVVAFRSGAASSLDTWLPRERLIFWLLLVTSLSALFFSRLPLALGAFLLSDATIWRSSSLALVPFLAGAVGAAWRANRRLKRVAGRERPRAVRRARSASTCSGRCSCSAWPV